MTWLYIFIPLVLVLLTYAVLSRNRLMLFHKINSITKDKTAMVRVDISVEKLAKLTRSTISHTIDTGNAILFEYKTEVYMAIPLGDSSPLVSHVADQNMMHTAITYQSFHNP
ncbi:MAG: hypothetical protein HF962_04360 [Sulfurovum sp.]|nr:hypothetical protein [Sulfurovum sp.]